MTIDTAIHIVLLAAAGLYLVSIVGLLLGLSRLPGPRFAGQPFVSIIVAARNESENMRSLLTALLAQNYPNFEIVIVDDRSTDDTGNIVRNMQKTNHQLSLVTIREVSSEMPAKKHALTRGILESKGEILCFTDADCIPPSGWVSSLVSYFEDGVGLVAGYSPYDRSIAKSTGSVMMAVLHSFIEYEEFKGAVWSAGAIGLSRGWLCTGRNLAYRRSLWNELGGFHDIRHSISGDDDLFLQLVRRKSRSSVRYALQRESFVPTAPPESLPSFVQQRMRHFSAGRFFPFSLKVFSILFHGSNLLLYASLGLALFVGGSFSWTIWLFIAKIIADGILVARGSQLLSTDFPRSYMVQDVLNVLYVVLLGPTGLLGRFEWKPEPRA